MTTATQTPEVTKHWNRLDRSERLELIESSIENCNTNEGFLMLRFWSKENCLGGSIATKLSNHLCVEAVSQSTLIELFGEDHDFQSEDAEVILTWMDSQK
jgi:hypothetical protein